MVPHLAPYASDCEGAARSATYDLFQSLGRPLWAGNRSELYSQSRDSRIQRLMSGRGTGIPKGRSPLGAFFVHFLLRDRKWAPGGRGAYRPSKYAPTSKGSRGLSFRKYSGWWGCPAFVRFPAENQRAFRFSPTAIMSRTHWGR